MRFQLYVPKEYVIDFDTFVKFHGRCSSRIICENIRQFNNINLKVDIPTLRMIMNDENKKKLQELLKEFD